MSPLDAGPHYSSWPVRLVAERRTRWDVDPAVDAISAGDIVGVELDVGQPLRIDATSERLVQLPAARDDALKALHSRPHEAGEAIILTDDEASPRVLVARQHSAVEDLDTLEVSLLQGAWTDLEADAVARLCSRLARMFGASIAYLEDSALQRLFVRDRPERLTARDLAAAGLDLSPGEPLSVPGAAPHLSALLPELRHRVEVDSEHVPAAIYWVNWWSSGIVETLGRRRVLEAGWGFVEVGDDGSLVLCTGAAPPDIGRADDLRELGRLARQLDLADRQAENLTARALFEG